MISFVRNIHFLLPRSMGLALVLAALVPAAVSAQSTFVNWENPHVHPLELTPDGHWLLAVNTADDRLEVFDASMPTLPLAFEVPVGIDPVSVRAFSNDEVWVVNHVSDSVSIVRLSTRNVVDTLKTDDEPCDVVFAGAPMKAFVSCSQVNRVQVFDPSNHTAAPMVVPLVGEDPRALAVSSDGTKVYVAIFESTNDSTILGGGAVSNIGFPPNVVNDTAGPYAGVNPPPNNGAGFNPSINLALPTPPRVGMIVKRNASGQWMDDNAGNWTSLVSGANAGLSGRPVGWELADHDVAIIDTATLTVTYARHLMNICMALAVNPASGDVAVVGTEGTNEVRFEPIVNGKFLRVKLGRITGGGATVGLSDLNTHLNYGAATVPQSERDKSLGDPRGIAFNSTGTKAYVTGMGSNNVVVIDAAGNRVGLTPTIDVGEGPTGVVLHEASNRLFVLNKFAASICVIDTASETVTRTVPFFDPSPVAIKAGRKHLYDTRKNSGLGQVSCASCHVDSRMDGLAWDLGDPSGSVAPVAGNNLAANIPGLAGGFQDFHPMKGPMTTQTLQDIIGQEPLHWRGDRAGLEAFNPAFQGLQGDDTNLTPAEMQQFEDFLATITYPPNPFRNFDNTLPTSLPLPGHFTTGRFGAAGLPMTNGNAQTGLSNYRTLNLDNNALRCVTCHTLPTGAGTDHRLVGATYQPIAPGPNGERHLMLVSQDGSTNVSMKVPQMRNDYEKTGFNMTQLVNTRGFGVLHDGSVDSLERFMAEPIFTVTSEQQIANLTAFVLAISGSELPMGSTTSLFEPPGPLSKDTHAAVGRQTTLIDFTSPATGQLALIDSMLTLANANKVGVVAKGLRGGLARGFSYSGAGIWQTDRAAETMSTATLESGAMPGSEITFTVVPRGTQIRIGIDRDLDTWFDRDEIDWGSDPADPASTPGGAGAGFCFGDGSGSPCPCGNTSPSGSGAGCLHSLGTGGRLAGSGDASIGFDGFTLLGSQMTNSSALYFQGTTQVNAGLGTAFGDGLRCAGGSVIRLGTKTNVAGASQYPAGGDASISVRGAVASPGTRTYQVWYRNAAAFCTIDTFNLTNGWRVVWSP